MSVAYSRGGGRLKKLGGQKVYYLFLFPSSFLDSKVMNRVQLCSNWTYDRGIGHGYLGSVFPTDLKTFFLNLLHWALFEAIKV